jgi:hypothetical protein
VSLVVEIKAVGDQFVEIDFGRSVKATLATVAAWPAVAATTITRSAASVTAASPITTASAISTASALGAAFAGSILLLSSLFFSHVNLI